MLIWGFAHLRHTCLWYQVAFQGALSLSFSLSLSLSFSIGAVRKEKNEQTVTNSASVAPSDRHQREPSPEY